MLWNDVLIWKREEKMVRFDENRITQQAYESIVRETLFRFDFRISIFSRKKKSNKTVFCSEEKGAVEQYNIFFSRERKLAEPTKYSYISMIKIVTQQRIERARVSEQFKWNWIHYFTFVVK